MSVKLKKESGNSDKDQVITFKKDDFMAVEGTSKSFFPGKVKVVHKVQGEKMIAQGKAIKSKAELEEVVNENRSTKDIK